MNHSRKRGYGNSQRRKEKREALFKEAVIDASDDGRVASELKKAECDIQGEAVERENVLVETVCCESSGEVSWLAHRGRKLRQAGMAYVSKADAPVLDASRQPFQLRQEIETEAPQVPTAPEPALIAEVEALSSYRDLFKRGLSRIEAAVSGAKKIEDAASAGDKTTGCYPQPVVLTMRDYTPIARKVFDAGYTFTVGADGKPHITVLEDIDMGENGMDTSDLRPRRMVGRHQIGHRQQQAEGRGHGTCIDISIGVIGTGLVLR
jgi:hypothetical protein